MKALLFLVALLSAPLAASAAATGYPLDRSPHDPRDLASLQSGARTYMNYCLGCHGLQYMRYQGFTELGLSEAQIRDNLMFTAEKLSEPVKMTLPAKDAKQWFGVAPPDLSVISRSRGPDWLYTYLRTFYRDPKTATGWNNPVFPNVGMPHALWTLQGERAFEKGQWKEISKGSQSPAEYDATVRDLVNFLTYVGEPHASDRRAIGIVVLFLLGIVFIFAWLLKKEYWKDVK